jgi:hypothetical protein
MLEFLQNLELAQMFAATLVLALICGWVILAVVRLAVRFSGIDASKSLPVHGNVLTSASGLFALLLAFSAASIWTDTLQARAAVQREANALENVFGLANALPADLRDTVKNGVINYAEGVVERDWPAMARKVAIGDPVYGNSDRVLVQLIDYLSSEVAGGLSSPATPALLGQLFEVRSARLSRLTLAGSGLTAAQWCGLLILCAFVFVLVAGLHNHHRGMQIVVMNLYAIAVAGAFLVILAHNGPFVGTASVSSTPFLDLSTKSVS